jgi:hypothetical protein
MELVLILHDNECLIDLHGLITHQNNLKKITTLEDLN